VAAVSVAIGLNGLATQGFGQAGDDSAGEFFEKQVRPVLVARCFECHSAEAEKIKGGLRLDSRAMVLKGGDTGPAVVPGKPKESLLVDAIHYGELYQMPPKSKLPAEEIAALTKWVEMGAPWGEGSGFGVQGSGEEFNLAKRKAEHWCWQPIKSVAPPSVKNEGWIKQPLDRFILARLEEKGLSPALPADERTLVRRAYFDLVGLPPGEEERERRGQGDKEGAYEALVDRLLASPHFGERWGRHWLDLVRYAESRGHEFDYDIPNAFEYRDYVIRALNADVPYHQFVMEHVAGDLVKQPRWNAREGFNESIIGTGFWYLGEWCHSPVDIRKDECERVDNMIDVFSKTFLGVTVACARCHDHKFDAISQRDYYALAGYLQSSSYRLARFETWQDDKRIAAELAELGAAYRPKVAAAVAKVLRPKVGELAERLAANAAGLVDELGVMQSDLRGGQVIVDYGRADAQAWMADGPTFEFVPAGQIVLNDDAAAPLEVAAYGAARRNLAWDDLGHAKVSENDPARLNGWLRAGRTLKTPTFTLNSGYVHYLIEGVGHVYAAVDSHVMINGPLHAELLKETGGSSDLPTRWITHDLSRYVGHRVHLEFSPKEEEDFRVLMVVEGAERPAAPARRPNQLVERIGTTAVHGSQMERVAACRELIESTLDLLAADRIATDVQASDRAAVANWIISQAKLDEQPVREIVDLVAACAGAREKVMQTARKDSRLCMAMWEGTPVDENLLIRGNHKTVGPVVGRRGLEALQRSEVGGQKSERGSRLDLARELVERNNPLVSRVIVNRVWQHLMGRGIVPSVDNFGVLGQQPTHPELLDYLAEEFVRDGWSIKRLVRRIMVSSAYRQRSEVRDQKSEGADPQNLLFHRQNLKRLEGEVLRDAILAVSGRLDRAMHGPSVPVYLTPFMQGRGRPRESGPLDGAGRRSIYVAVRRNFLSPMMLAYDTPIPFSTVGSRNVSNVPAQALILMNDPFVAEQSRNWARTLLTDVTASPADRIRRMYLAAMYREPTAVETASAAAPTLFST
jgi:cytochrome c553